MIVPCGVSLQCGSTKKCCEDKLNDESYERDSKPSYINDAPAEFEANVFGKHTTSLKLHPTQQAPPEQPIRASTNDPPLPGSHTLASSRSDAAHSVQKHGDKNALDDAGVATLGQRLKIEDLQAIDCRGEPLSCSKWALGGPCPQKLLVSPPKDSFLGMGGFGIVWRAMNKNSREWYAVKTLLARKPWEEAMAERECDTCEILAGCSHPCIVSTFATFKLDASLCSIVMELCTSEDLWQIMLNDHRPQGHRRAPNPSALHWIGQVFLALEHLHLKAYVVMCDLKPPNVLFDKYGSAKLSDFGLARSLRDAGGLAWKALVGTPGYCAPEQVAQEQCTAATDLYSLGVLSWVLFTGGFDDMDSSGRPCPRPPLQDKRMAKPSRDDWQLLRQCLHTPEKFNVYPLPEDVREFLLQLVHQHPEQRAAHEALRRATIFASLRLPSAEATSEEIRKWVTEPNSPSLPACCSIKSDGIGNIFSRNSSRKEQRASQGDGTLTRAAAIVKRLGGGRATNGFIR